MIKVIIGIIIILLLIGVPVMALAVLSSNHVKCPKCGEDMEYIGNDSDIKLFDELPGYIKHHYYRCPKCGATKII